jgi:hypothetical protein
MQIKRYIALPILLAVGFGVRAISPLFFTNIANPDEVYQTVEQAYRLLTNHGFLTWEYFYGIRSPIIPAFLALIIKSSWGLGLDSVETFIALRLTMAALSLVIILCAYTWGQRSALPGAGLLAGGLVAVWPDLVFYSSHPLSDVIGAAFLLPGICLAETPDEVQPRAARIFWVAVLLSAASILRFQFGPTAVLVLGLLVWPAWRTRLVPAVLGGIIPLLIGTIADWISLGRPLQSIWLNFLVNWSYEASAVFGTAPWYAYFGKLAVMWGGAIPFVAGAALLGVARGRLIAIAAISLLLTLVIVPHKEYRFLYPMIPLVLALAGIGTARIIQIMQRLWAGGKEVNRILATNTMIGVGLLTWLISAGGLYLSQEFLHLFRKNVGIVAASFAIARTPGICGIAIWNMDWSDLAGEFSFGRPLPVFYPQTEEEFQSRQSSFNAVLYNKRYSLPKGKWEVQGCYPIDAELPVLFRISPSNGDVCVAMRKASCDTGVPLVPPLAIPRPLKDKPVRWLTHSLPQDKFYWPLK